MKHVPALTLIDRFQAKARVFRNGPQRTANRVWRSLKPHLTKTETIAISVAWNHVLIGEGPDELDHVCQLVKNRLLFRMQLPRTPT